MSKMKIGLLVASVAVMSSFALGAQARGGGGGGGGGFGGGHGGMSSEAGGVIGGGHGGMSNEARGTSGSHMSSHGMTNTNGFNSADRDKGLQRAGDRSHQHAHARHSTAHSGKHKALGRTK